MRNRFTPSRRKVRFSLRDGWTLQALFAARYLTAQMVQRLFYGATTASWCRQRLRNLFDAGYVRKRKVMPNDPDVYFLGRLGRKYISIVSAYDRSRVDKIAGVPGEVLSPMLMMHHELTLAALYVQVVLECRRQAYKLEWKNSRTLELERLGVGPDAQLRLVGQNRSQPAFLEFTAAMPTHAELAHKVRCYEAHFDAYGAVTVLWLTDSHKKLKRLRAAARVSRYAQWFLFGVLGDAHELLTDKIWWRADGTEVVRFVAPSAKSPCQPASEPTSRSSSVPPGEGGEIISNDGKT